MNVNNKPMYLHLDINCSSHRIKNNSSKHEHIITRLDCWFKSQPSRIKIYR